jgi:hypothetical protein
VPWLAALPALTNTPFTFSAVPPQLQGMFPTGIQIDGEVGRYMRVIVKKSSRV